MIDSISKVKSILNDYKRYMLFKAFIFILVVGIGIALAQLFRDHAIESGYNKPSPLMIYPTLFGYAAYSIVAFLFPWSWKIAKEKLGLKIAAIGLTAVAFAILYLFILSLLEWMVSPRSYNFWNGYRFTLYHSGLMTLLVYFVLAGVLFLFGITKRKAEKRKEYLTRIPLKIRNTNSFIPVEEIQLFEANDNYVSIYLGDGQHHLVRQTLHSLENKLDPDIFQRVHRKYIVNVDRITSWKADPSGGYNIYLPNEQTIKMSKSYMHKLKFLTEN